MGDYNKLYYKKNRKKILRRKKDKYDDDSSYRTKARRRSRQQYARRRKSDPCVIDRKVMSTPSALCVSIGKVAELCNRNVATIRKYHRLGILPDPHIYSSRGWRLYTQEQALLLVAAFRRLDAKEIKVRDLILEVKERWLV